MYKLLLILFLISAMNASGQWIRQNPIPTGETINCFYFHPNSSTGWAGGGGGILMKTTNFGSSWEAQPQFNLSVINKIQFINLQTGWVSFSSDGYYYGFGGLMKTTNGGVNWFFIYQYSGDFIFLDSNTGYMLFQPNVVAKTINGGYNWLLYTVGGISNECMFFLNGQTGYTAGTYFGNGVIYKTTNGGLNWNLINYYFNGFHFNSLYFSDEQNGIAIGYDANNAIKCFVSTNGGAKWKASYTNLIRPVIHSEFKNVSTGFLMTDYNCARTTNGGINWNVIRDSMNAPYTAFYFNGKDSGFVCNQNAQMYRTYNSGNNWQNIYGQYNSELKDIKFIDDNTGWAVGGRGVVWRTSNSGTNWNSYITDTNCNLKSVCFINSQTGWAGGYDTLSGSKLFYTSNGGINWIVKSSPARKVSIVKFSDNNNGWVAFDSLYRTTNGCVNWINMGIYAGWLEFSSMQFIDSQTGWISGYEMFKTTNGGNNWFIIPYGGGNMHNSMYFINAQTGWIGWLNSNNNGESVYKTTNGGYNWVSVNIYGGNFVQNIKFVNQNSGWVIASPYVHKTTNGGINWNRYLLPSNNTINSLYFVNENTGWIAGKNSTIIKSINGGVGIKQIENTIPTGFKLSQNYPNPFNPITKIKFSVPQVRHLFGGSSPRVPGGDLVQLKIFDITGREIQTLVNEKLQAGSYEVTFDGSALSSGVYFYQLTSGNFKETKKLMLLK